VLTTAGPFALHGDKLVAACVQERTDYVDITGESPWVATLIERFHAQAEKDGTRIIPFCGFDSIPSDIGAWALVQHIRKARGVGTREVQASFTLKGGVNGGTIASGLNMAESGQSKRILKPDLLQPPGSPRFTGPDRRTVTWDPARKKYLTPFVMAAINTRVVARSATLYANWGLPYGNGFTYQESMETSSWAGAWTTTLGLGLVDATLRRPWARSLARKVVPAPGAGPSEATMDGGFFRARHTAVDEAGGKSWLIVSDKGDPGNRSTVRMLCESAFTLLAHRDELPPYGGVLTPATALGAPLLRRLIAAGMTWQTGDGELP
jgi:short subunit dehydrogenase-like uncharacterized protein